MLKELLHKFADLGKHAIARPGHPSPMGGHYPTGLREIDARNSTADAPVEQKHPFSKQLITDPFILLDPLAPYRQPLPFDPLEAYPNHIDSSSCWCDPMLEVWQGGQSLWQHRLEVH